MSATGWTILAAVIVLLILVVVAFVVVAFGDVFQAMLDALFGGGKIDSAGKLGFGGKQGFGSKQGWAGPPPASPSEGLALLLPQN